MPTLRIPHPTANTSPKPTYFLPTRSRNTHSRPQKRKANPPERLTQPLEPFLRPIPRPLRKLRIIPLRIPPRLLHRIADFPAQRAQSDALDIQIRRNRRDHPGALGAETFARRPAHLAEEGGALRGEWVLVVVFCFSVVVRAGVSWVGLGGRRGRERFLGGPEGAAAFFGTVAVFGRGGIGGVRLCGGGFGEFGGGFGDEGGVLEVIAVELAEARVLVDFDLGFELAGAEVAAFFGEVCEGLRGRLGLLGMFGFGSLRF